MNENTLVSVHCYGADITAPVRWDINTAGDAYIAENLLPIHEKHKAPIVILSPVNAPVKVMGPHICRQAGVRAYIGQESLDRQIAHLKILLEYPFEFYLLNDADSCCISAEIPSVLYASSADALWSNEVVEPRPHTSPYPKLAAQPPYFLNRRSLAKIVETAPGIEAHPITPYIDWAMLAWSCEAGLSHHAFSELENQPPDPRSNDSIEGRYFRIRNGAVMIHPIKSGEGRDKCLAARKVYEQSLNRS